MGLKPYFTGVELGFHKSINSKYNIMKNRFFLFSSLLITLSFISMGCSQPSPTTSTSSADDVLETKECFDCDLTGKNFAGVDLVGARLNGSNLSGVNLAGANLSGALLDGVDLSGANLTDANLTAVALANAN